MSAKAQAEVRLKNIYEIPHGWRVIINRSDLRYQAFVAFGGDKAAALQKAIAIRDEYFALVGVAESPSGQRARSNTGISGISEQTKWFHGKPYYCFEVSCGHPRKGTRRFYYRNVSGREQALAAAIEHRNQRVAATYPKTEVACV